MSTGVFLNRTDGIRLVRGHVRLQLRLTKCSPDPRIVLPNTLKVEPSIVKYVSCTLLHNYKGNFDVVRQVFVIHAVKK